jgi:hypothetical protein
MNNFKQCTKCGEVKSSDGFYKNKRYKNGLNPICMVCKSIYDKKYKQEHKEEIKEYRQEHKEEAREYRQEHKEDAGEYQREYRLDNPEKIKEIRKRNYEKHKEEKREYGKQYRNGHKEERNKKERLRRQIDIQYKIRHNISTAINQQLKKQLLNKGGKSTCKILGDDYPKKCVEHLESLFEPWMNKDNYGRERGCWTIDHIKAQSRFNFVNSNGTLNEDEIRKCWALENLRPMEFIENIKKKNKLIY